MKNFKKVLALVLVVAMMMSFVVVASAKTTKDYTDAASVKYTEAVDVLSYIEVLSGYPAGDFKPTNAITRAEAAKIIAIFKNGDTKISDLYKSANPFADVKGNWAESFIAYCAQSGIVSGRNATTFDPQANVTGIEFLKMALVVLGYDADAEEFKGANWAVNVLAMAKEAGLLVSKTWDPAKPITREEAAQVMLNALNADKVAYGYKSIGIPTAAILTSKAGAFKTGVELYKDWGLSKADTADKWGRPGYKWVKGGKTVTTVLETPDAVYTTAQTECQIAADLGLKADKKFSVIKNGAPGVARYVQLLDTVGEIGAQGTLVEFYNDYDLYIEIETYLAKVTAVKDATFDANGHLKTPSQIDLAVIINATDTVPAANLTLTNESTNYTYAKGDWVLVNVHGGIGDNRTLNDTTNAKSDILGKAASFDGAQTYIWTAAPRHTVDGTDYLDAAQFNLDQAGVQTAKHTWFKDQYGNLIGVIDIATVYAYGIIENIQWINPAGAAGYAQATIRYMDGTTEVKTVKAIDKDWNGTLTEAETLKYAQGNGVYASCDVSTSFQANGEFCGKHLYRIETLSDGKVVLAHVFTTAGSDNEQDHVTLKKDLTSVTHSQTWFWTWTIDVGMNLYINSNTVFLVQKVSGSTVSYEVVTGFENISDYTASATIDWVVGDDGYAKYVYIIGTPDDVTGNALFFPTSKEIKEVLKSSGGTDHYEVKGILNGVPGTYSFAGTENLINLTNLNLNRLYRVTLTNGKLSGANALTGNSYWDYLGADYGDYKNCRVYTYIPVAEPVAGTVTWIGNALYLNGTRFTVTSDKVVFGALAADLSDKIVYVVAATADNTVKAVYIADVAETEKNKTDDPVVSYKLTVGADKKFVLTRYEDGVQTNLVPTTCSVKVYDNAGDLVATSLTVGSDGKTEALTVSNGTYYATVTVTEGSVTYVVTSNKIVIAGTAT